MGVLLVVIMQSSVLLGAWAKPVVSEANSNNSGFKFLSAGNYPKALECFNSAARDCPDSAEAHFGRAAALRHLGRKEESVKEYRLALLLNPSKEIKQKSEAGLSVLEGNCSESVDAEPLSSSLTAVEAERSISKILSQSEERIKNIHSSSERFATGLYSGKMAAQHKMLEAAKQEADEMRAAVRMRRGSMRSGIPGALSDIDQYEADLRKKADFFLNRSRNDYDKHRKDAQSRAIGIKSSAEGLQSQMLTKPSETSGIFLMPKGTNLYVRNYGHFDPVMPEPPEPLAPLSAVPLKLPAVLKMEQELKQNQKHIPHKKTSQLKIQAPGG